MIIMTHRDIKQGVKITAHQQMSGLPAISMVIMRLIFLLKLLIAYGLATFYVTLEWTLYPH